MLFPVASQSPVDRSPLISEDMPRRTARSIGMAEINCQTRAESRSSGETATYPKPRLKGRRWRNPLSLAASVKPLLLNTFTCHRDLLLLQVSWQLLSHGSEALLSP